MLKRLTSAQHTRVHSFMALLRQEGLNDVEFVVTHTAVTPRTRLHTKYTTTLVKKRLAKTQACRHLNVQSLKIRSVKDFP